MSGPCPGHREPPRWGAGIACRSERRRDRIPDVARSPRQVAQAWQPDAALLDGLTIAAVALDADGVVVYANAAALDLFGSPFDELIGSDARVRLFDEPERGVVDEVLALVRSSGAWTGDVAMLCGGHRVAILETSWTPVRREGAPSGALLLAEVPSGVSPGEGELATQGEDTVAPLPLGRRLRRLASVTRELLAAETVEQVAGIVTDHMMNAAGATVASISLLVDDQTLALMGIRGGLEGVASRWATYALDSNTPAAESVRTGRPLLRRPRGVRASLPRPRGRRTRQPVAPVPAPGRQRRTDPRRRLAVLPGPARDRRGREPVPPAARRLLRDEHRPDQRAAGGRRPGGEADLPGRGEREAVERPGLRGDADRGGRGRGAVVRRLVRDLARRRTACCAPSRWRTPTPS